jgi:eukaryotic-like serine/threonine-protein kinase
MVLQIGQQLQNGAYTIDRELRRGRFTITFLARRSNGEKWVIKVLNPMVLAELEAIAPSERLHLEEQFKKEAFTLATCDGAPHIVRVDNRFEENGVLCLPMEYMDGNSLADRGQKMLTEEEALRYIRQVGKSLAIMHQKKLVHCDIRPANIFLRSRNGIQEAVLTDLGLVLDFDTQLSRTLRWAWVDGFSAPELYTRDKPMRACTDVYSLAATLYQLVTGETPPSAYKRLTNPVGSPGDKNPELSEMTNQAILAGLKTVPEERPSSVLAWLKMLPRERSSFLSVWRTKLSTGKSSKLVKKPVNWVALGVGATFLAVIPAWAIWLQIYPNPPKAPTNPEKPLSSSSPAAVQTKLEKSMDSIN